MTEIRQCWAFHRDGMRCEHPAGHPGDHVVQKTWTDLECATPGEFGESPIIATVSTASLREALAAPAPSIPIPPDPDPADAGKCVACNHKHKGGPCKCGCYEFVG